MPKFNDKKIMQTKKNKEKLELQHYGKKPFFHFFSEKVFLENENWTILNCPFLKFSKKNLKQKKAYNNILHWNAYKYNINNKMNAKMK